MARIRAEVAAGLDPGAMLMVYADPARRRTLHERVRRAAHADLSEPEVDALAAELFGFGVLQPLLDDPEVTDVLVNAADEIFVERDGLLQRTDVRFEDPARITELAHRIAPALAPALPLHPPSAHAPIPHRTRA